MKRIFPIVMAFIMLFLSVGTIQAAQDNSSDIVYTLVGYGIIDPEKEYNPDEPVSRGEFAGMVTRLMCISESASQYAQTPYWDVPSNYKYAGDISVLTAIGILNGYSDTRFGPNDSVTYEQALKVLVLITGYGEIAQANGGWPDGYITQASKNKMLGGVSLKNPFTRENLYKLIYNTLDVPLVDHAINHSGGKLEKTDDTLRNQIAEKTEYELYRHRGVIKASAYTYTSAPYSDLYDDEVVIDNRTVGGDYIYSIGNTNASDLVGYEVEFFAKKTVAGYELLSVKPTTNNEIIEVRSENLRNKNGYKLFYSVGNKNMDLTLDDDYKVVYNGNRVMNPGDDDFNIEDGYITFINNDSDKNFELAMIWEYENAIATSFDGVRMNFANDAQFNSLTSLNVKPDDDEVKVVVMDKDGNDIDRFDSERVVSIFMNTTRTRFKIIVSDEIFDGAVSSMSEDEYTIDDTDYQSAASLEPIRLGVTYKFYFDYQSKIAYAKETETVNYGYILDYSGNRSSNLEVRIIIPGKVDAGVETNEEDVTDTSAVPYLILQNNSVEYFKFAEKVRSQGKRYKGKELIELLDTEGMKAISYKLNSDGEICEITPLEKCGGNITKRYQYDVYDRVFGGTTVDQTTGFAINSDTMAVCVPADDNNNINYNATDDDFNVRVNITVANNDVGYRVEGYDYDPITKKARFLVSFATMDASAVTGIDGFSSKASIVTSSRYSYNEETDEYDLIIEVLQGSAVKTLTPIPLNSNNRTIGLLKKGDLITFSLNKNDLMANAYIMQSLPDVSGRQNFESVSGNVLKSLGTVGKIEYDEIDTYNRALITKIELHTDDSGYPRTLNVRQKNTPPVYLYDTQENTYTAVSIKDIIPDYDRVFVYERNGDGAIRAIVIIR